MRVNVKNILQGYIHTTKLWAYADKKQKRIKQVLCYGGGILFIPLFFHVTVTGNFVIANIRNGVGGGGRSRKVATI